MKRDANFVDPFYTTCLNCPIQGGCVYESNDIPNDLCPIMSGEAQPTPQTVDTDKYLYIGEAAKFIGIGESTLWQWINDGKIVAIQLGAHAQYPYVIPKKYAQYAKELVEDGIRLKR